MTASAVDVLPAGDHTDPAIKGLQLRVRKRSSGLSRTWLLRYRWRDEAVRLVLGHRPTMSLADARERALELRRAIDDGIDPRRARPRRREAKPQAKATGAPARDSQHTVEFLAGEFMERFVRPKRKRPEYAQAILNRDVLPAWRGRDARTIRPREVIDLLDSIVDRGSPVAANRTAAILSQMFRFGIHRTIVETSPVQLLMRPGGRESSRKRTLTDAELRAFLTDPRAATRFERLEHVMLALLYTGQRRGELALARWKDIDFKARTWTIPPENSKTGVGHVVPLTGDAAREFRVLRNLAGGSKFVLPAVDAEKPLDPKQLTRSLARCRDRMKKLGIEEFTLHDLRRTCRTGLARLKVVPHIAERVLNHAQDKMEGTYDVHDYLDEKRAALEKWAAHLRGLVA